MLAHMADWRQIQARIRKAKASTDAPAQLAELYERTHDAMVAFEMAHWYEKAADNTEAVRWYTLAAERFRRAQWRTKSEEALIRLGGAIPVYTTELLPESKSSEPRSGMKQEEKNEAEAGVSLGAEPSELESEPQSEGESEAHPSAEPTPRAARPPAAPFAAPRAAPDDRREPVPHEAAGAESSSAQPAHANGEAVSSETAGKKRRRRGRRGGRKRRTTGAGAPSHAESQGESPALSGSDQETDQNAGAVVRPPMARSASARRSSGATNGGAGFAVAPSRSSGSAASIEAASAASGIGPHESEHVTPPSSGAGDTARTDHPLPIAEHDASSAPERSAEPAAAAPAWQSRTRAGEPALVSRISHLESQLRRLLACPLASLDDFEQAPAGPGVLLLSDSDQVTYYYIESCQTLRIGIGNLLRGARGTKDGGLLKARLAENLGIAESRVARYLKDHCAVRWLQLDEGAAELAHFAIAVLRPVANE